MEASWPRLDSSRDDGYSDEEEMMILRNVCVCVVCVVFQVESKRGKRLTGKEIKRKTLAERRQPLGIDNLREDGLR